MTNKEHVEKILYELKPFIEIKYRPLGFDFEKIKNIVFESKLNIEKYNIESGLSHFIYYMIEIDKIVNYYLSTLLKLDTDESLHLEEILIDKYMSVANYVTNFKKIIIDNNLKENLISKSLYEYDGKTILSIAIAKKIINEIGDSRTLTIK